MKKNGFTLTEMIAVIVIIGVILLITIPVMNNVISNNKEEKYMFYVETVEKALYSYGDLEFPMTVYESGTTDLKENEVTLNTLISNNYLKRFNESGVTVANITFKITKKNGKVTIVDPTDFKLEFKKSGATVANCSKTDCS